MTTAIYGTGNLFLQVIEPSQVRLDRNITTTINIEPGVEYWVGIAPSDQKPNTLILQSPKIPCTRGTRMGSLRRTKKQTVVLSSKPLMVDGNKLPSLFNTCLCPIEEQKQSHYWTESFEDVDENGCIQALEVVLQEW